MKQEVELLIYDLDGTLIDSVADIANAVNHMRGELGYAPLPKTRVIEYIGVGVQNLVGRSLGPENQSQCKQGLKILKKYYSEHLLDHTVLYPDVARVLEHFKTKKQAVLTNKPEAFTKKILAGLHIQDYFFCIIGGDSGFPRKPSTSSIDHLIEKTGVERQRAVMIGDSLLDIETGKTAGIISCAVTYGLGIADELRAAQPDFLIDRFASLADLFC